MVTVPVLVIMLNEPAYELKAASVHCSGAVEHGTM